MCFSTIPRSGSARALRFPSPTLLLKPNRVCLLTRSSANPGFGWAQWALAPQGDGAAVRSAQRLVSALALARLDVRPMPTLARLPLHSTPLAL